MGKIEANISGGISPYNIVVRKSGEITGNRCIGACNSFPVDFTEDSGAGNYYFIVTDANGCVTDSRNTSGGVGSINCDVTAPDFQYETTPIVCVGENRQPGNVRIYNITNATRYRVCYASSVFICTSCETSTGVVTPGQDVNVIIPLSTPGVNSDYSIRFYNGNGCEVYKDINGSMANPICQTLDEPEFVAAVIQPYCSTVSNGQLQNAVLKLSNVVNATRYKICYNSTTFTSSCNNNCAGSDGVINSGTKDIQIIAPAQGISQTNTIRVYNGTGCEIFKDYTFSIYSQKCNIGELSMMNLDLQVFQNPTFSKCDVPSSYVVEYDFHITPNTPGMTENGVRVRTTTGAQRTLPNGNDVPNVFIAAGVKAVCGGGTEVNPGVGVNTTFYRYTWNMSLLKAKYPNINEFSFDVYAERTKKTSEATVNAKFIRPVINAFKGVAMVKEWYNNNSNDAYRSPRYDGDACRGTGTCGQGIPDCCPDAYGVFESDQTHLTDIEYKDTIIGSRKIATIKFNYATNKVTWIP